MVRRRRRVRTGQALRPRALIIVQNLPVPFDRRVWLECQALRDAGYDVSVICPKGPGDPRQQVIDDVELFKYRPYPPTQAKIGFVAEYVYSLVMTAWLTVKVWRRHPFQVIQTCNPPDIFWPLLMFFRYARGTMVVFDQHDLCPELYESRFPEGPHLPHRVLLLLERLTYRAAHHVVATNESYRATAVARGGKRPDEVTVVRSAPNLERLCRVPVDPAVRRDRAVHVAYLGVMGPQDGVDIVIQAAAVLVHQFGRRDIGFTLIGSGDCFHDLVALARSLGVDDYIEFTGRAPDEQVFRVLSSADIGLCPDPKNPLNDVSTMNKTMEYMAFELPVVAFDLRETRVSAADAAIYVEPNDVELYAKAIVELADDVGRRRSMGELGRRRVEGVLAWRHSREAYVGVYDGLLGRAQSQPQLGDAVATPPSQLT